MNITYYKANVRELAAKVPQKIIPPNWEGEFSATVGELTANFKLNLRGLNRTLEACDRWTVTVMKDYSRMDFSDSFFGEYIVIDNK